MRHPLIKGTSIVLVGAMAANLLNFLFNFVMGRILAPADFAEVVTLFALIMLLGISTEALTKLAAKNVASDMAMGQSNQLRTQIKKLRRYSALGVSGLVIIFWLSAPWISGALTIDIVPLLIFGLILVPLTLLSLDMGVLQGFQAFGSFSLVQVILAALKIGLAVVFVSLGFSVAGVVAALLSAILISYLYGHWRTRSLFSQKIKLEQQSESPRKEAKKKNHSGSIVVATLVLAGITNVDVIMAKYYFSPELAGQYSALSVVGKILIFGAAALVVVMFPMIAASHERRDRSQKSLINLSLGLTLLGAVVIVAAFFILPEPIIRLLFGLNYVSVAPYLGWFGVGTALIALAMVVIHYFMATHARYFIWPMMAILGLEIYLIILFHENIFEVTRAIVLTGIVLAGVTFFQYWTTRRSWQPDF